VHFRMFGFPSPDYADVRDEEARELERERVRLWYVALTRARDLLLLPRQSERVANDWFGVLELDLKDLPKLDLERFELSAPQPSKNTSNSQDRLTWKRESDAIAASQRTIVWHQPSRHEGPAPPEEIEEVFVGAEAMLERTPLADEDVSIQGGPERGLVLHKLIEEVLTHETADDQASLKARARDLLAQRGLADTEDPALGPCSSEIAASVERALQLPEIVALRPWLPEFRVYAAATSDRIIMLTAGVADAVAFDDTGGITWSSTGKATRPRQHTSSRDTAPRCATTSWQPMLRLGSLSSLHQVA
jgi:ATP-dependent exoDNAse (exonuclease V) beta subunit